MIYLKRKARILSGTTLVKPKYLISNNNKWDLELDEAMIMSKNIMVITLSSFIFRLKMRLK